MKRASPKMRAFAQRLIAFESKLLKVSGVNSSSLFPIVERLRPQLATLMGNAGFRALLLRALALAKSEVPWLAEAEVTPTGSLKLSDELVERVTPKKILDGKVAVIAHLLGLMVAFIGEKLTVQLVRDVWPKVSLEDLNASKEISS